MKRSEINTIYREAKHCFEAHGWALPPKPRWDITDFGLGEFEKFGLALINLAEEQEYCEKLMYARIRQTTPLHTHKKKKEDIICRHGVLELILWEAHPDHSKTGGQFAVQINQASVSVYNSKPIRLQAGERITLLPGVYHEFTSVSDDCIIGEVSTANDDLNDNFFVNSDIGRYPGIEEDEPSQVTLVSEMEQ